MEELKENFIKYFKFQPKEVELKDAFQKNKEFVQEKSFNTSNSIINLLTCNYIASTTKHKMARRLEMEESPIVGQIFTLNKHHP